MNDRGWEEFCNAHPDIEDALIEGVQTHHQNTVSADPTPATEEVRRYARYVSGQFAPAKDKWPERRPRGLIDLELTVDTPTQSTFRLTVDKQLLGALFVAMARIMEEGDQPSAFRCSLFTRILLEKMRDETRYGL